MGRRKAKKRVVARKSPTVSRIFDCPFCDHSRTVECKLNKRNKVGRINCRICNVNFECQIHYLSEPVDVYSEWIDECTKSNTIQQIPEDDDIDDGQEVQEDDDIHHKSNPHHRNQNNDDYSDYDSNDYQHTNLKKQGLIYKEYDTDDEEDIHTNKKRYGKKSKEIESDSEEEEEYANTTQVQHIPEQERIETKEEVRETVVLQVENTPETQKTVGISETQMEKNVNQQQFYVNANANRMQMTQNVHGSGVMNNYMFNKPMVGSANDQQIQYNVQQPSAVNYNFNEQNMNYYQQPMSYAPNYGSPAQQQQSVPVYGNYVQGGNTYFMNTMNNPSLQNQRM